MTSLSGGKVYKKAKAGGIFLKKNSMKDEEKPWIQKPVKKITREKETTNSRGATPSSTRSKTPKEEEIKKPKSPKSKTDAKDSSKAKTKDSSKEKSKDSKEESCIFCQKSSTKFGAAGLERHYAEECKYLTNCPQCKLLVEIPNLYPHLHGSCELFKSDSKHCKRCNKLVPLKEYKTHVSKKACKEWNPDRDPGICGLCNQKVVGESGWKVHLLTESGCTRNDSRSKTKKSAKKSVAFNS